MKGDVQRGCVRQARASAKQDAEEKHVVRAEWATFRMLVGVEQSGHVRVLESRRSFRVYAVFSLNFNLPSPSFAIYDLETTLMTVEKL